MKTCVAAVLLLFSVCCHSAEAVINRPDQPGGYPENEAATAWRGLAASYIRKAIRDGTLVGDAAQHSRIDAVMNAVATAAGKIDPRHVNAAWRAILIDDFGHGAVSFPGGTIIVDAKFVSRLKLSDHEIALILSHEVAHVLAGHAVAKLSFMAQTLGREKVPDAHAALQEFLAKDSYAAAFLPTARRQEREADALGAQILLEAGFDTARALGLFDKLAAMDGRGDPAIPDPHDDAIERKQYILKALEDYKRLRAGREATTARPAVTTR